MDILYIVKLFPLKTTKSSQEKTKNYYQSTHLTMNSKLFILFLSFCLFSSCSTMLEIITGDYKCAYPNCNERATTNSVYCPYHKPYYLK